MEQLQAAIRRQKLEEAKAQAPDGEAQADQNDDQSQAAAKDKSIKHENIVRLKFLARDISKLIRIEQKRVAAVKEAENLERLRL